MDFEEIYKQLKDDLFLLLGDKIKDFTNEGKGDIDEFLDKSKEKLKRWSLLLESGDLTVEDFTWLVQSQKDLLTMHALYQTGLSKIKLGLFKNSIINTIIKTIVGFIF